MRLINALFTAVFVSVFRTVFRLGRRLVNYVVRNPNARKVAGWGCLTLLALWLGGALLSALVSVLEQLGAGEGALALVGTAVIIGVIVYLFATRPTWRARVKLFWTRTKNRVLGESEEPWEGGTIATETADDDLLDRIVIMEDKEG